MKKKLKILCTDEIQALKDRFSSFTFQRDTDLVYENQIPNTGVVLLNGEINLTRRSKVLEKITNHAALGVYQLIHNEPVKIGIKVKGTSEIILLNKSEVREILDEDEKSTLKSILLRLV